MSNTINWGKIYEKTAWGIGVVTNTISWGKIYANLAGSIPSFALNFANIATDFTFTRSSFATRVNEQGLIETVTDLGSELVQNGDFEELGSELVVNGTFDTDSNWVKETGWIIEDGYAESTALNTRSIYQDVGNPVIGKTYQVTYTVLETNGGNFRFNYGGVNGAIINNVGTYTENIVATSDSDRNLYFDALNVMIGKIDNVSVKQVDPNDNWDLGGWTIENGKAFSDGVNLGNINQSGLLSLNSRYKISVSVKDYNSGKLNVRLGTGAQIFVADGLGNFELELENTTSNDALRFYPDPSDPFDGSIDNISVQEVLEDDVPRIDYTNSTFDDVLGSELITNGDFATDSDWSFSNVSGDNGWRIADGRAICDATGALNGRNLQQTLPTTLIAGQTYRLSLDILQSADAMQISLGGVTQFSLPIGTNLGYSIDFIPTTTSNFLTIFGGTSDLQEIDNISVKKVVGEIATDKGEFLLEPQSTNLLPYSEDFTQWTVNGTLTSNAGISPDGTQNADLLDATPVAGRLRYIITSSASTDYVVSMYVKGVTISNLNAKFRVYEPASFTFITTTGIGSQLVVGEWVRIEVPFTTNLGGDIHIRLMEDMPIGDSAFVWGAQVEALPYATSYIPTNGSTVTRSAETCVDATPTINSEEGVLYAEISALADDGTNRSIALSDGTTSNRVNILFGASVNSIRAIVSSGGVTQFDEQNIVTSTLDTHKIAFKYKENDFALWIDGTEVVTDTSGITFSIGTLTKLNFNVGDTSLPFYGNTKDLKIYDKALTDDELIELTTI